MVLVILPSICISYYDVVIQRNFQSYLGILGELLTAKVKETIEI